MVENLTSKTKAWEKENKSEFFIDGIPLLSMLEDYSILRQEKENERQRQRDQRKLQGRLLAEKEALFGSKPSPTKSGKRAPRYSVGGGTAYNRRFSTSAPLLQKQNLKSEKTPLRSHQNNNLLPAQQNNVHSHQKIGGNKNNSIIGKAQKKQAKPTNPRDFRLCDAVSNTVNQTYATPEKQNLVTLTPVSGNKTPKSTPIKSKSEEKYNLLITPTTLSAKSASPCTPFAVRVDEAANDGVFEYSFEEIRAGFVLPQRTTVKSALQF